MSERFTEYGTPTSWEGDVPYHGTTPYFESPEGVALTEDEWRALNEKDMHTRIVARTVQRDYIVSTIWVGLKITGQVFETATILERDDITVPRGWSTSREEALALQTLWEIKMSKGEWR